MMVCRMVVPVMWLMCCGLATAQDAPRDWGECWQPALPDHEQHPSLFYDESDRPGMRERIQREPYKRWWEALGKSGLRTSPALKWWLAGDEEAAKQAHTNLLETPIWRQKPQGYLEPSSHRFADYVAAYDILAAWEGLSDADHAIIRDRIAAEADHYLSVMEGGVPGGCNFGNQRTLAASALGMAALTLCEYADSPNGPARWLGCALEQIRRDDNFWFFRPDGLFVEGLGYTNYMNVQFVPFAIAYERASGKYIFEDERLRQWLTFAAYQMLANGELVPWGTCESGKGLGFFGVLCNARYGRDLAPLFQQAFTLPSSPIPHPYHLHIALAQYEPDVAGDAPSASRAFPASQTVVLRENWGHDTVSVWFAGKDGTWPLKYRYGTYSHGDAGHFVLAAWDEVLAADSGYDHWKSRDYYGAPFHNVILVDGEGPAQDTPGAMTSIEVGGPVRHATVSTEYEGCTLRRTLALVRGRYVVIADKITADEPHEYTWQVRSACPPDSEGTALSGREVTWPGLDSARWRNLVPGRTLLTVVGPSFAQWSLESGRWRPMSGKPEFINQVALARWQAQSTVGLFILIPNLQDAPDVSWEPLEGQGISVKGPGWEDLVTISEDRLTVAARDGAFNQDMSL